MLFFDKNDLFTQMARQKEQREMDQSKVYYTKEINVLTHIKQGLINNPGTIEKFARENCLMKRDNEDIFLVSEKSDKANN
jgi:cell division protein DivIC